MMHIDAGNIKEIYSLIKDDTSKTVFENRMMYSLTGDMRFIRKAVCTVNIGKKIYERIKKADRPIGIFGAGSAGKHFIQTYHNLSHLKCFIDNQGFDTLCEGLPVYSLVRFREVYPDGMVLISSNIYHKEMLEQLLKMGIEETDVVNVGLEYEKLNHKQYFDLPELENFRKDQEVFVDGGAYNGNTSIDFKNWSSGNECFVYAWEPDPKNRMRCGSVLRNSNMEYELVPKGLWEKSEELKFHMEGTSSAITDLGEGISIEADSIDHICTRPVTFIKMDVEGAEYRALLGAREAIKKYKPKLAVCIYHKPEDIWELPWLIHQLNPEYGFYFRHYSFTNYETVLYAL